MLPIRPRTSGLSADVSVESDSRPQIHRRSRHKDAKWEAVKPTIHRLYIVERRNETEVREILQRGEFKFKTGRRKFYEKLREWKFDKNKKPHQGLVRNSLASKFDNEPVLDIEHALAPTAETTVAFDFLESDDLQLSWPSSQPWLLFLNQHCRPSKYKDVIPRAEIQAITVSVLKVVHDLINRCSDTDSPLALQKLPEQLLSLPGRSNKADMFDYSDTYKLLISLMPEGDKTSNYLLAHCIHGHIGTTMSIISMLELLLYLVSDNLRAGLSFHEMDEAIMDSIDTLLKMKVAFHTCISFLQLKSQALAFRIFAAAVRLSRTDVLKTLIDVGFDIRVMINQQIPSNNELRSINKSLRSILPIHFSLIRSDMEMVRFLFSYGADLKRVTISGCCEYSSILAATAPWEDRRKFEAVKFASEKVGFPATELQILAALNNLTGIPDRNQIVNLLLDHLELLLQRSEPECPIGTLVYAIRHHRRDLANTIIALLTEADSSNSLYISSSDNALCSPLFEAIILGDSALCKVLLDVGINQMPDEWLPSGLHFAAHVGQIEVMRLLIERGASINYFWNRDHYYSRSEDEPCGPKFIVNRLKAGYDHLVIYNGTPLTWAIRGKQEQAVELLLHMGAACGSEGLRLAVFYNSFELSQSILNHGIVPDIRCIIGIIKTRDDTFESLLRYPQVNLNQSTARNESLFAFAIIYERISLQSWLANMSLSCYNATELLAAVYISVKTADISFVTKLLEQRKVFDVSLEQCSLPESLALATSVYFGDKDVLSLLINHGVSFSQSAIETFQNNNGKYVGKFSASSEHIFIWGDDDDGVLRAKLMMERYDTLLMVAVRRNRCDIFDQLVKHGYQPCAMDLKRTITDYNQPMQVKVFDWLMEHGYQLCSDALHCALEVGNGIMAMKILQSPGYVYERLEDRPTPLAYAISWRLSSMIELFLANQTMIADEVQGKESSPHPTALQSASAAGNIPLIKKLIKLGVNPNELGAGLGLATSLQHAASNGYIGAVKVLIEAGADINAPSLDERDGRTVLEAAAEHGYIDMIHYLLYKGVKTKGDGQYQYLRAVKFATEEGHPVAVGILKSHRPWTREDHEIFGKISVC